MSIKHVLSPFTAWVRALTKPYTVPKARTMRPGAPAYRGWHVNDTDTCVGCGTCTRGVCFVDAIRFEDGRAVVGPACRGCGRCVEACPEGAIELRLDPDGVDRTLARLAAAVDLQ